MGSEGHDPHYGIRPCSSPGVHPPTFARRFVSLLSSGRSTRPTTLTTLHDGSLFRFPMSVPPFRYGRWLLFPFQVLSLQHLVEGLVSYGFKTARLTLPTMLPIVAA
jgi:hypothetical protein